MAFCTQCGKKLEAGVRFCPQCGTAAAAVSAPTATEQYRAATEEQIAADLKEKGGKKKVVILPLIFACVAIMLEIIGFCMMMRGMPREAILHNLKIVNYFMALVIPAAALILGLTCRSKKVFKIGAVVSFVMAGLQVIWAIAMVVFRLTEDVAFLNGSMFFMSPYYTLLRGLKGIPAIRLFVRCIGSGFMIAKNIVSGAAFAKFSKQV